MQILIKFTSLAELNRVKNANFWIRIQRKMYHLNRVFRIRDIFGYESIDTTPFFMPVLYILRYVRCVLQPGYRAIINSKTGTGTVREFGRGRHVTVR